METKIDSKKEVHLIISERAVNKLKEFLRKTGKTGLRLRVIPTYEGYMYEMGFEKKAHTNDVVIEEDGLRLFINEQSIEAIRGCEIDFYNNPEGCSFRLNKPTEKKVII